MLESQGYAEHEINQTCPKCEEKIPLNEVIKINCSVSFFFVFNKTYVSYNYNNLLLSRS